MATLGDIRNLVVKDILGRSDEFRSLGLICARNAYWSICGKVPFAELRRTSDEINVTANDPMVDISSLNVAGIRTVRYYDNSSATYRLLLPKSGEEFEAQATIVTRASSNYARETGGTTLELYPIPDDSNDTIRLKYWAFPAITDPSDEDELVTHVLSIPFEWEELLMWETLHRIYCASNSPEHMQMALMLMGINPQPAMGSTRKVYSREMGIIPRLWNDLLMTKESRENVGRRDSIRPEMRRYTHG